MPLRYLTMPFSMCKCDSRGSETYRANYETDNAITGRLHVMGCRRYPTSSWYGELVLGSVSTRHTRLLKSVCLDSGIDLVLDSFMLKLSRMLCMYLVCVMYITSSKWTIFIPRNHWISPMSVMLNRLFKTIFSLNRVQPSTAMINM